MGLKVLVVEDEGTICLTLSYLLNKAGYRVTTCSRVDEAGQLIDSQTFFLVLIDLVLTVKGRLDGLEIVKTIKRRSPGTRVIVMTAYGSNEVRQQALNGGADSYWDKPLDVAELLKEIRRLEPTSTPGETNVDRLS
jgi:DNA-binding response OmpR family regulator